MKLLLTLALLLTCCTGQLTMPRGYRACRIDSDCHANEYCGFVHVDTYAVCKPGNDQAPYPEPTRF